MNAKRFANVMIGLVLVAILCLQYHNGHRLTATITAGFFTQENGTSIGDIGVDFSPTYRLPESKWDVTALYAMCISSKINFKVFVYQFDQKALVMPFLTKWEATYEEMMKHHDYHVENMYSWPAVLEELWGLEGLVTKDPEEADVFLIPTHAMDLYMALSYIHVGQSDKWGEAISEYMESVIGEISRLHPYWNRYTGARHILMMPNDPGRCDFTTRRAKELLWNTTILHPNGDASADHSTCLGGVSRDIIMPPRSVLGGFYKENLTSHSSPSWDNLFGADRPSKRIASFVGSISQGDKDSQLFYSYGSRQYLSQYLLGHPGFEYRERFKRREDYVKSLSTSDFTLHLPGWQLWSPRLFDGIAFGSLPVIIGEYYVLPFEQFIPYHDFVIHIGWNQLRFLPNILNSISPQQKLAMRTAMRKYVPFLLYNELAHQATFASICLKEKALPISYELYPTK